MASKKTAQQFQWLARRPRLAGRAVVTPFRPAPTTRRPMATVSSAPASYLPTHPQQPLSSPQPTDPITTTTILPPQPKPTHAQPPHTVLTTIHAFPTMSPSRFAYYPTHSLFLPLRRDLLHRAIVHEASLTRQGTASTKWRDDVHGSHRKVHPQKGQGLARAGDKQSPIRRGGGVAHGPSPRDFANRLHRKMYDRAWRTALSHRYRKGELVVVERMGRVWNAAPWYMRQMLEGNGWWGSMMVAAELNRENRKLFQGVQRVGEGAARMVTVEEVDVKNLLEMERVVIEYEALNEILARHSSDVVAPVQQRLAAPVAEPTTLTPA